MARMRPEPVEAFMKFALEAKLDHAIIVTPEPYQGDPSYMESCLPGMMETSSRRFACSIPSIRGHRKG